MEGKAAYRLTIVLLVVVLTAAHGTVARAATTPPTTLHLLVRFDQSATASERAALLRDVGGHVEGEIAALGITRVAITVERHTDPEAVVRAIAAHRGVALAERDVRVHLDWTSNDPYWETDPYVGLGQWGEKKVLLDRALDVIADPLQPVTVAIIDTGVDAGHPDLAGAVLPGITILSSQSAPCTAEGGGRDDNSHGTHIAGIIAADANNGVGIAGIASNARILPIKALDCTGSGSLGDIAQGITYAVDHGARVVNISLGASTDSATLEAAVQYAVARSVLIVAAVGNCGVATSRCLNTEDLVEYPGASPGVLAVAATAPDDSVASFSTRGTQVALSAPGVRIVSTTPHYPTYQSQRGATMNYAAFSGTSQAAPFVAGAAALLLGIDPRLTASQVAARLEATASDLGAPGADDVYGAGRLDLLRAASATVPSFSARYDTSFVPHSTTTDAAFTAKVAITNTSRTAWSASGPSAVALSYHWVSRNGDAVVSDGTPTPLAADVQPGSTVTVDMHVVGPSSRGSYLLRVDLYRAGIGWFSSRGVPPADVDVVVRPGQAAAYAPLTLNVWLPVSAPSPLVVALKNTGSQGWSAAGEHPVRLSYHWMRDGVTIVWDGARASFGADVLPGETVTVELPIVPPKDLGQHTLRLDLVEEGVHWFSEEGVASSDVAYVVTSGYGAEYTTATSSVGPIASPSPIQVTLRNTGMRAWPAGGAHPVMLSYHWLRAGAVVVWDGVRVALMRDVQPGEAITVDLSPLAPTDEDAYTLRIDLVEEGVRWFSQAGIAARDLPYLFARPD